MARTGSTAARRAGLDAAEHDGTLDELEHPFPPAGGGDGGSCGDGDGYRLSAIGYRLSADR